MMKGAVYIWIVYGIWKNLWNMLLWIWYNSIKEGIALSAAKATAANMDSLGRAVNERLNCSYVGFPCSVRTSVRVAHLDAEYNTLAAYITLCHLLTPPITCHFKTSSSIVTQVIWICKGFMHIFFKICVIFEKIRA